MALSRRSVLKGGAAGVASLAASGARRGQAAPNPKILNAVMQGDLRSFDPVWTTAEITADYANMIYDVLFAPDAALRPRPQMIGDWDLSPDRRTYRFALRDGLVWHDGSPVTATDCVASIRRWAARNPAGQMMMDGAKDLSARDDKSFVLSLREPFGLVLAALCPSARPDCFIMPKKVAETDPFQQITSHVGSGPFTFNEGESRPGSRFVFDRFAQYVPRAEPASGLAGGKVVHLDRVIWHDIADDAAALAALEADQIDFFELPPADLVPQLRSNPDIKLCVLNGSGNIGMMRLNCLHPPFSNVKARRAMLYLVSQEEIMKANFGNPKYYNTVASWFGYRTPMTNDANTAWFRKAPDPDFARQLFEESGYQGEKVVILQATDFDFMNNSAQIIAGWLKEIGVNAELAPSTWGDIVSRRAVMAPDDQGGWDISIIYGSNEDFADPITNIPQVANGRKGWFGWPENPEYEALRKQWARVETLAERQAIAHKMQAIAWDFVPMVLLGQWVSPAAMRRNVHGLIAAPDIIAFWNVSKT